MFERILELFFHAKAGALAGLILIGTTGALVTATVSSSNNVTTITLTQASASPSGSASPSVSPAARTASPSPTVKPTPAAAPAAAPAASDSSSSASACTDDAHAMSDAVKTVNAAFSKYHVDLMHMRNDPKSDAAKKIVDDTDKLLKTLRQNAVKAIHATSACAKAESDDEDATEKDDTDADENDENDKTDENDDNDKSEKSSKKSSETNFIVVLFNNLFGNNTTTTTASTTTTSNATTMTTLTLTGDPKAIADAAVAAMKLAFDDATAKLKALPSASPKATKSPHPVSPDTKGKKDSGKGSSRADREGDDD